MKNTFFLLIYISIFATLSNIGLFAQKNISLEESVLKQWTSFAPSNLPGLHWQPNSNEPVALSSDRKSYEQIIKDAQRTKLVSLEDINSGLGIDMKGLPSIEWKNKEEFFFHFKNNYYHFNIKSKKGGLMLSHSEKAENLDVHHGTAQVAFTIGNNLFLANSKEQEKGISKIEDKNIVSGQAFARSEFGIVKGTFWSSKGNYLAFYQKDETEVSDYPLLDISTTPGTLKSIKYPMAGQKSEQARIGIYDVKSDKVLYLKIEGEKDQYLTNLAWDPSEQFVYIAVVNRDQNHLWMNKYSVKDGQLVKTLFEEEHPKYVEPENAAWFLPNDSTQFLWMSERDGFMHLYRYNTDGKLLNQVTNGKWVVSSILGLDATKKCVLVEGTDESGLNSYAYSADLKSGKVTRLANDVAGVHHFQLSSDGSLLIDQYSNLTKPNVIRIIQTNNSKVLHTLLDATNPYKEHNIGTTKIVSLKTDDGTDLHARVILPSHFDSTRQYPVLVYVYGGPHAQMLRNSWLADAPLWMHYMAEKGYIIFTLDNRGSKNRGFEFESIIHRQLGTVEVNDQMIGVNYLKSLPYVDANRMAVHGWSYGGFMTISLMLKTPGVFKVGVAGGPVTDWKYYEIMYGERYMDRPEQNIEGYEKNTLSNYVKNLKGDLLLIHGTVDDVVVMQHNLVLVKAFVDAGILVDFFPYPMHPHNVRGKDRVHLMNKVLTYIEEKLR